VTGIAVTAIANAVASCKLQQAQADFAQLAAKWSLGTVKMLQSCKIKQFEVASDSGAYHCAKNGQISNHRQAPVQQ
jgi:hypothetical protein